MTFTTTATRQKLSHIHPGDSEGSAPMSIFTAEFGIGLGYKDKPTLKLLNGVTGYEEFHIEDLLKNFPFKDTDRVMWCAGTPGRWDRVFVKGPEMNEVLKAVKQYLKL